MLRESEPFELTDPREPLRLRSAARDSLACGAAGFVLGFLRGGAPDVAAVQEVLGPVAAPATFHRAFDEIDRPLGAVAALAVEPRLDRLLTSGGAGQWQARLARLRAFRAPAAPPLPPPPPGGVDPAAPRRLA